MSNKEEKFSFDDDDDDWGDDWLDLDEEGGFNGKPASKKRQVVDGLKGGFVSGLKDTAKSDSFRRRMIQGSLPRGYAAAYDSATLFSEKMGRSSRAISSELKKQKEEIHEAFAPIMKSAAKIAPAPIGEKLERWADSVKKRYDPGSTEPGALEAASAINEIFSGMMQQQTSEKQLAIAQENQAEQKLQTDISRNSNQLLASMSKNIDRITAYQNSVNIAYQKKTLELQFKQLFTQRKTLDVLEQTKQLQVTAFESIIKNTGLPDVVKIHKSEAFTRHIRDSIYQKVTGNLTENVGGLISKLTDSFTKRAIDTIKEVGSTITGLSGEAQSISEMADNFSDLGGGGGLFKTAAEFLGQLAFGKARDASEKHLINLIKSKLDGNEKVGDIGKVLEIFHKRAGRYANSNLMTGQTGFGLLDGLMNWIGASEHAVSRNYTLQSSIAGNLQDAAVFDLQTKKTITEVIPGLLSRINQGIGVLNGNTNSPLVAWDWKRSDWTTEKRITQEAKDEVLARSGARYTLEREKKFFDAIDPDHKLDKDTRIALSKAISRAGRDGQDLSLKDLVDSLEGREYNEQFYQFIKEKTGQDPELWDEQLRKMDPVNYAKNSSKLGNDWLNVELALQDMLTGMHRDYNSADPQQMLQRFIKEGNVRLLKDLDFVKAGLDGTYSIDGDKYFDFIRNNADFDELYINPNAKPEEKKHNPFFKMDKLKEKMPKGLMKFFGDINNSVNGFFDKTMGKAVNKAGEYFTAENGKKVKDWVKEKAPGYAAGLGAMFIPTAASGADLLNSVDISNPTTAIAAAAATAATAAVAGTVKHFKDKKKAEENEFTDWDEVDDQDYYRSLNGTSGLSKRRQKKLNQKQSRSRDKVDEGFKGKVNLKETNQTLKDILSQLKANNVSSNVKALNEQLVALGDQILAMGSIASAPADGKQQPPDLRGLSFGQRQVLKLYNLPSKGIALGKTMIGALWRYQKAVLSFGAKAIPSVVRFAAWPFRRRKNEDGTMGRSPVGAILSTLFGLGTTAATTGMNFTKAYYNKLWGITKTGAGMGKDLAKRLWNGGRDKASSKFKEVKDEIWKKGVYLKGELSPRLDMISIELGKYRNAVTGKVVQTLEDLTGDIIDEDGNIVLTYDQIKRGIVDKTGELIDTAKERFEDFRTSGGAGRRKWLGLLGNGIGWITRKTLHAYKWMFQKVGNLTKAVTGWGETKDFNSLFNFGIFKSSNEQLEETIKIRKILENKFGVLNTAFNDKDHDGERDGGLTDRKKWYERLKDKLSKKKDDKKEEKKEGKEKKGLLGFLGKLISGAFSGLGSLISKGIGLLGSGLGGMLLKATGTAAAAMVGKFGIEWIINKFFRNAPRTGVTKEDPRIDPNSPSYDPALAQWVQENGGPDDPGFIAGMWDHFSQHSPYWSLAAGYGTYRLGKWGLGKLVGKGKDLLGKGFNSVKNLSGNKVGKLMEGAGGLIGRIPKFRGVGSAIGKAGKWIKGLGSFGRGATAAAEVGSGVASAAHAARLARRAQRMASGAALPEVIHLGHAGSQVVHPAQQVLQLGYIPRTGTSVNNAVAAIGHQASHVNPHLLNVDPRVLGATANATRDANVLNHWANLTQTHGLPRVGNIVDESGRVIQSASHLPALPAPTALRALPAPAVTSRALVPYNPNNVANAIRDVTPVNTVVANNPGRFGKFLGKAGKALSSGKMAKIGAAGTILAAGSAGYSLIHSKPVDANGIPIVDGQTHNYDPGKLGVGVAALETASLGRTAARVIGAKGEREVAMKTMSKLGKMVARKGAVKVAEKVGLKVAGHALGYAIPFLGEALMVYDVLSTGYDVYKSISAKSNTYTRARMVGYGYDITNEDAVPALMALEKYLFTFTSYKTGNNAYVSKSMDVTEAAKPFGVDMNNPEQAKKFTDWFTGRFLPMYCAYMSGAKTLNIDGDLSKGDKLKPSIQMHLVKLMLAVTKGFNDGPHPYTVMTSPYPTEDQVELDQDDARDIMKSITDKLQSKIQAGDEGDDAAAVNKKDLKKEAKAKGVDISKDNKGAMANKSINPNSSDAKTNNNTGTSNSSSSTSSGGSWWDKTKSAFSSFFNFGDGLGKTTSGGGVAGIGGSIPQLGGTNLLTTPKGGTYANIPQSQGVGWKANKDLIIAAANAVGVDAGLIARMSAQESGFNPSVRSKGSSATGLFQFIDSTWSTMMRRYASKFGIPAGTPATDARANALLGAQYVRDNIVALKTTNPGDAYLAHFRGLDGAKADLKADQNAPASTTTSSTVISKNKAIYYKKDGTLRTIGEVRQVLTQNMIEKGKQFGVDIPLGGGTVSLTSTKTASASTTTTTGSSTSSSYTGGGIAGIGGSIQKAKAALDVSDTRKQLEAAVKSAPKGAALRRAKAKLAKFNQDNPPTVTDSEAKDNNKATAKETKCLASLPANSKPAIAAAWVRAHALGKSVGHCAKHVRMGLQAAGYRFVQEESAKNYGHNRRLEPAGFTQIAVSTAWQVGDVMIFNSYYKGTEFHKHGHIQIWDGNNWVSDFVQQRVFPNTASHHIQLWRDSNYLNGAQPVTGWGTNADITGSSGVGVTTADGMSSSTGGGGSTGTGGGETFFGRSLTGIKGTFKMSKGIGGDELTALYNKQKGSVVNKNGNDEMVTIGSAAKDSDKINSLSDLPPALNDTVPHLDKKYDYAKDSISSKTGALSAIPTADGLYRIDKGTKSNDRTVTKHDSVIRRMEIERVEQAKVEAKRTVAIQKAREEHHSTVEQVAIQALQVHKAQLSELTRIGKLMEAVVNQQRNRRPNESTQSNTANNTPQSGQQPFTPNSTRNISTRIKEPVSMQKSFR